MSYPLAHPHILAPSPRPGLFTLTRRVAKKPIRSVHDPLSKSARRSFAPKSPFHVRCGFRADERTIRYIVDTNRY